MKRAEAVQKIIEVLKDEDMYSGFIDVTLDRVADKVLKKLEDEGMLPPAKKCPVLLRNENRWE